MSKQPKQFERAELEAMPWHQLIELANSGSDEMNRVSESDLRELAFGEFVLSQQRANQQQQAEAEAEAKAAALSTEELRRMVTAEMVKERDAAQLASDRQSVEEEPFELLSRGELDAIRLKAERNERLRESGQSDFLDNSDDSGEVATPSNDNNHNNPSDDPRYNQAREDSDYVLRASEDALDAVLQEKLGVTTEEVAKLKEANAINQSRAIQQAFVERHADFIPNETNANILTDFIRARGHSELTASNLEEAFAARKAIVTAQTEATPSQSRNGRRASSVSSRGRAPNHPTGYTEAQLREMPMEQLRDLANQQEANESARAAGWSYDR